MSNGWTSWCPNVDWLDGVSPNVHCSNILCQTVKGLDSVCTAGLTAYVKLSNGWTMYFQVSSRWRVLDKTVQWLDSVFTIVQWLYVIFPTVPPLASLVTKCPNGLTVQPLHKCVKCSINYKNLAKQFVSKKLCLLLENFDKINLFFWTVLYFLVSWPEPLSLSEMGDTPSFPFTLSWILKEITLPKHLPLPSYDR